MDVETAWRTNPSIVVAQVLGYGQAGRLDYLGRALEEKWMV
jgi:crotonobetainyl-CoA:carnitine CoA-transferase CaiB-like acyl-CoA transferase